MAQAWVTLATNDTYAIGALVLGESLKRVGTTKFMHIMLTSAVTQSIREQLARYYSISDVNILDSQDGAKLALLARPDLGVTFTKLHCWTLTQFSKAVFLDADCMIMKNCDELFDYPELSAVPDVGWPDMFNSGVFVYVPSMDTFNALLNFATQHGSFDGGDQGLLNSYFHDWFSKGPSNRLSFIYNMNSNVAYTYLAAWKKFGQNVKIVHFLGAIKPWHHNYDRQSQKLNFRSDSYSRPEHVELWWRMFTESIAPNLHPDVLTAWSEEILSGRSEDTIQMAHSQGVGTQDHQAAWERGNIEYMGRDAWENIQKQLDETLK